MSANFTPSYVPYTPPAPFKFWCQTVLPSVYDDALSYYELLNKVVEYLNDMSGGLASIESNMAGLYAAYSQLQQYVNDYFNNLDLQTEIDRKLDTMAVDGTLSAMVQPYISGYVSAWLSANITPADPEIIIDKSLSIPGAAADAAATGGGIRAALDAVINDGYAHINPAWSIGNINAAGQDGLLETWWKSNYINVKPGTIFEYRGEKKEVINNTEYTVSHYIVFYTVNAGTGTITPIEGTPRESFTTNKVPEGADYVRFTIGFSSTYELDSPPDIDKFDAVILPAYAPEIYNNIRVLSPIGKMLEIAETYFNKHFAGTNVFTYTSGRGLFAKNVMDENPDYYAINCSELVQALIKAVSFEYSRYTSGNDGVNYNDPCAFISDGSGTYAAGSNNSNYDTVADANERNTADYMISANLAKYFYDKDELFPFYYDFSTTENHPVGGVDTDIDVPVGKNQNHNGIRPGDILFFADDSNNDSAHWENIDHCAICVEPYPDNMAVIESGTSHPLWFHSRDYKKTFVSAATTDDVKYYYLKYYARPHMSGMASAPLIWKSDEIYNIEIPSSSTAPETSALFETAHFNKSLAPGFYTVEWEQTGGSACRVWIDHEDAAWPNIPNDQKFFAPLLCGKIKVVIYSSDSIADIYLRAYGPLSATFDVSNVRIYKGYHAD